MNDAHGNDHAFRSQTTRTSGENATGRPTPGRAPKTTRLPGRPHAAVQRKLGPESSASSGDSEQPDASYWTYHPMTDAAFRGEAPATEARAQDGEPAKNSKRHTIQLAIHPSSKVSKAVNAAPTDGKVTKDEGVQMNSGSGGNAAVSVKSLKVTHSSTSETETTASHRFDIRAEFDNESPDWDFRQDIQGYWKLDGVKQVLKSSGSGLTVPETGWVDDGYTKADDTNGDKKVFETNDNPGGGFEKDKVEDYYLKFRARIIDTKNGNADLKTKSGYWIRINGKYPRAFTQGGFD